VQGLTKSEEAAAYFKGYVDAVNWDTLLIECALK
jgi:hypothetical protein